MHGEALGFCGRPGRRLAPPSYARGPDDPRPEHADGGGHDRRPRQLRSLPRPGTSLSLSAPLACLYFIFNSPPCMYEQIIQ